MSVIFRVQTINTNPRGPPSNRGWGLPVGSNQSEAKGAVGRAARILCACPPGEVRHPGGGGGWLSSGGVGSLSPGGWPSGQGGGGGGAITPGGGRALQSGVGGNCGERALLLALTTPDSRWRATPPQGWSPYFPPQREFSHLRVSIDLKTTPEFRHIISLFSSAPVWNIGEKGV